MGSGKHWTPVKADGLNQDGGRPTAMHYLAVKA